MRGGPHRSEIRGALLALAVIALLLRIAVPPGTMIAHTDHGAALVTCTGHGPMSAMATPGKTPMSKTHGDGSCEFAAHVAHGLAIPLLEPFGHTDWTPVVAPRPIILAATGSGLAAPPPPSHAPPARLV